MFTELLIFVATVFVSSLLSALGVRFLAKQQVHSLLARAWNDGVITKSAMTTLKTRVEAEL